MIHEKNLKQKKILWHCPFKAIHQRTQEYTDVISQNLSKILSPATITLKSRVNEFLKRKIQEFIFKFRVLTILIISHPFLNHFHRKTVSSKSPPPPREWRRKPADGCRATFSLRPNSSDSEKAWFSFNL